MSYTEGEIFEVILRGAFVYISMVFNMPGHIYVL